MTRAAVVLLVLIVLYPLPAHAYIDPGSGSAILSAIIGFFVAIGLALKGWGYKIKGLFTRKKPAKAVEEPEPPPPQS